MSANQQIQWTATVNVAGATGPLQQLQSQFGATGSAASSSQGGLNSFSNSATQSGSAAKGTTSAITPLTGALGGAGTAAKSTQGAMGPLGQSFGGVATGGINANNALVPLQGSMQKTEGSSVSLGQKIGLMGGFMASTAGSVAGLVTGYFALQAAQVAVDRAQLRVNTSALAVTHAQDAYNKAIAKFGPDSHEAIVAHTNLINKIEANRVSTERLAVTQDRSREAWISMGISLITVGGSFAQMGSTLSILGGKLAGTAGAAGVAATAETALGAAGEVGAAGQSSLSAASIRAAISARLAAAATFLLSASFLELAIPIGIAIGLFALIETNTFGMGDAFRSTVTVIAVGIDAMINGLIGLWNQFVMGANSINQWGAIVNNVWVRVHDAFATTFNSMIGGAATFVQQLENTFIGIYNFFVSNFINPMIGAWNTFMKGLEMVGAMAMDTLTGVFRQAFGVMLTVADKVVGQLDDSLKTVGNHSFDTLRQALDDTQKSLNDTGGVATSFAAGVNASFKGIDTIKPVTIDVKNFNQSFIPLIGTYANVTQAGHVFDAFLKEQNVTVAEDIAKSVEYYSHWNNVQSLFTGRLGPALQAIVKYVWDNVAGGAAWISKLLGINDVAGQTANTSDKLAGSMGKGAAITSTYGDKVKQASIQVAQLAGAIQHGTELQDAANSGYQKASLALLQLRVDTSEEWGELQKYNEALQKGTLWQENFTKGIVDGAMKFVDFVAKTAQAIASQQVYSDKLKVTVDALGFLNTGLEATDKNMEMFFAAAKGGVDAMAQLKAAVTALVDSFYKLGQEVGNKLGEALGKGHKEFKKVLKEMEKETGIKFDPEQKLALSIDAAMSGAAATAKKDVGVLVAMITGGLSGQEVGNAAAGMMASISKKFADAGPTVTGQVQKIFNDITTIANTPPAGRAPLIAGLMKDMTALGVTSDETETILGALPPAAKIAAAGLLPLSVAAAATASAYQKMGDKVDATTGIVTNSTGQVVGAINNVTGAFEPLPGAISATSGPIGTFDQQVQQAGTIGSVWQTILQGIAVQFNTSFKTAVNDAAGYLKALTIATQVFVTTALVNSLGKGITNATVAVNIGFSKMAQDVAGYMKTMTTTIQVFVRTGLIDSLTKGVAQATAAVNTGFSKMSGDIGGYTKTMTGTIQAFVRTAFVNSLELGASQAQTRLATAFNAMLSNIRTTTGQMITLINGVKTAILAVPTTHNTAFTGDVSSLSSAVGQAKSLIASVPASHNTTLTITTIQRIVQQIVPFSGYTTETIPSSSYGGNSGGNNQLDKIIYILNQILGKDEVIIMDGKEVGRLVRKHIFEGIT